MFRKCKDVSPGVLETGSRDVLLCRQGVFQRTVALPATTSPAYRRHPCGRKPELLRRDWQGDLDRRLWAGRRVGSSDRQLESCSDLQVGRFGRSLFIGVAAPRVLCGRRHSVPEAGEHEATHIGSSGRRVEAWMTRAARGLYPLTAGPTGCAPCSRLITALGTARLDLDPVGSRGRVEAPSSRTIPLRRRPA